jgi:hypothetical protein
MSHVTMILTVNLIIAARNRVLAPCLFLHFVKSHVLGKSMLYETGFIPNDLSHV